MPLRVKVGFELSFRAGGVIPLRPRGRATFVIAVSDSKILVDVEEIVLDNWYQGMLSLVKEYLQEKLASDLTVAVNKALKELPKQDKRVVRLYIISGE